MIRLLPDGFYALKRTKPTRVSAGSRRATHNVIPDLIRDLTLL